MSYELKVGDLVTFKNSLAKRADFYFIWDEIGNGDTKEFIVNVRPEIAETLRLKLLDKSQNSRLFQLFEYVKVKPYELFVRNKKELPDWEFLSWIITNRTEGNYMGELMFSFLLQSRSDFFEFDDILLHSVFPKVLKDSHCTANEREINLFNDGVVSGKMKEHLTYILMESKFFWLIKRCRNVSMISKQIITDNKLCIHARSAENQDMLKKLTEILYGGTDYSTVVYYPKDTSKNRTIAHKAGNSFFQLLEKEVKNFESARKEGFEAFEKIKDEQADPEWSKLDYSEIENGILNGVFPGFQKLFFKNLGNNLPIEKCVRGKRSNDYNLAFYVPVFKYLIPDSFALNPKLSSSDQRRLHIRRIKNFIAGKI